jgi:aspartate aminotransferase
MFERVDIAPPDPILGLEEAFKRDPNPAKINLAVGVFKDATGNTPVLRVVKRAEQQILHEEITKTYIGIAGRPDYVAAVQELVLGADHPAMVDRRVATAHTPGGTAALRVAAELIKTASPSARVWLSQPTWPNHATIIRAAGLQVETYPYFAAATNSLAFAQMMSALEKIPSGDAVLIHGGCHNPTGIDPTVDQWDAIARMLADRKLLPLLDFAYQGLADGLVEDAAGVRLVCRLVNEALVATSYSKNFGLYNERVGALTLVAGSSAVAEAALSQMKTTIRANYSNPPAHGGKIVTTILRSPELRAEWDREVAEIRNRIQTMRRLFVKELAARGVERDFSFIERQHGMFSFTGLTKDQVRALRDRYSIYIVDSGRVNVAGINEGNLPALCAAIADVVQGSIQAV